MRVKLIVATVLLMALPALPALAGAYTTATIRSGGIRLNHYYDTDKDGTSVTLNESGVTLGDAAGANSWAWFDSTGAERASIDSDGNLATSGSVDVALNVDVLGNILAGGTITAFDTVTAAGADLDGAVTINASGANKDFKVYATDTTDVLFICDASTTRVGIGTSAPSSALQVVGTVTATQFAGGGAGVTGVVLDPGAVTNNAVVLWDGVGGAAVQNSVVTIDPATGVLAGVTDAGLNGAVTINEAGADKNFRLEGLNDINNLVSDAGTDRVGVGLAAPAYKFDAFYDGESYVAGLERQTNDTNSAMGVLLITADCEGDAVDGFGAAMYFKIDDNADYTTGTMAGITAIRSGADNSGSLNFLTNNAGSLTVKTTITTGGAVFMPDVYGDDINGATYRDLLVKDDGQLGYDSSARFVDGLPNKINERDIPTTEAARIMALRPKIYDRVSGARDEIGLIAEEVAAVMPELVSYRRIEHVTTTTRELDNGEVEILTSRTFTTSDEPRTVVYSKLIARLLWMVQRQEAQIEAQAAELAVERARNDVQDARLDALERGVTPMAAKRPLFDWIDLDKLPYEVIIDEEDLVNQPLEVHGDITAAHLAQMKAERFNQGALHQ